MTSSSNKTVIFWGAGATATLDMRTTAEQGKFIGALANADGGQRSERIQKALGKSAVDPWLSALDDLLVILGDQDKDKDKDEGEERLSSATSDQIEAMRRNWRSGAGEGELIGRITALRTLYDWPALKAVVDVCPTKTEGGFNITDLFNVLDMHGQSGHGFRVRGDEFLTHQQVLGARNALKMLLQAMFFIDYQNYLAAEKLDLKHHYDFATALGRRMQRQGLALAGDKKFDSRDFYLGDVSFVSMNYDPIALWCQFAANRTLNRSPSAPHVGSPASRLEIYHDLGHFVAGAQVGKKENRDEDTPWHPMNESSAQRLNDPDHGANLRIRIGKFLFPHGCLSWRECPDCGKLSSYLGDSWDWDSQTLVPPPPLEAFVRNGLLFRSRRPKEGEAWSKGEVDARACVHCGTLTYAHHTQTQMQSNFKDPPPPFLEEIRRDLRVAVQQADHIILMGYSLPPDDVPYRAFFTARKKRSDLKTQVRCSVVDYGREPRWYGPKECQSLLEVMKPGEPPPKALEAASEVFGRENVRFYGGGIPQVFLNESGTVTESAVETLLTWRE